MSAATSELLVLGTVTLLLLGTAALSILRSARGAPVRVRELPALAETARAVASAAAADRPVFFVPGSRDLDNMQTVAALALLEQVAELCAREAAELKVLVNRSLVMTSAREACRRGFASAGRSASWDDAQVDYVSDDPLGFVARVEGLVARERPGACFFFGFFASESLLLAEGARQVGAVQVAGTASAVQLPFFVVSCDQTLIGEEFFAAGAALSGDAAMLGSLRGQDIGKWIAMALVLAGAILATAAATGWDAAASAWEAVQGLLPEG